ncbi:hypothetical protein [Streptomyces sp. NPDC000410]|uniref:hypothetical protein n=1 Tax=Streptomyces sp. NPDC000410 TaxID=3154254 RepID=UPI0033261FDE
MHPYGGDMPRTTALDPLFTAVDSASFTDRHLANLAAGTLAAVRVPDFLDTATCRAALAALDRLPTGDYDTARVPTPIVRFGPALNDYRGKAGQLDAGRYWRDADAARAAGIGPGCALTRSPSLWPASAPPGAPPSPRPPSPAARSSAGRSVRSTPGP